MRKRPLRYNGKLKEVARTLRRNMTESEQVLWSRLRGKQLFGIQFYRQKPIGNHIVDFFAPRAELVVEVDGSQHAMTDHAEKDRERDRYLMSPGIRVLRFNSREVLRDTDSVVEAIYQAMEQRLYKEIPLDPPLRKGE
jgi:very-short-patch-repair endonuclease